MNTIEDTITAIATPLGEGGISVIRVSGENAFQLVSELFRKDAGGRQRFDLARADSHTIHHGYIFSQSRLVDECLISVFRNPHSYTGEDVAEISCHGGTLVASVVLTAVLSAGARHAEPGEFTRRAFLNGKLDLSQAEAVADLIRSKTEAAQSASLRQLEGELSQLVKSSRAELIRVTSLLELELDFAEEGLELVSKNEIREMISDLSEKLKSIVSTFIAGKVIREGVSLVIAGRPNSGKSSLFNKLLASDRAIVSGTAGTTRDFLEENLVINGVLFRLTDTAGIRSSEDEIESEGIRRSHSKISGADIAIYLIDSGLSPEVRDEEKKFFAENFKTGKSLLLYSKSDLANSLEDDDGIAVSIFDDDSLNALRRKMSELAVSGNRSYGTGEIVITNLRHKLCLERVIGSLENAVTSIDAGMSGEFISVDIRSAMSHLGEITGEVTNAEILNNIFSSFCIGK